MAFESVKSTLLDNLSPLDFVEGLYDGSIRKPALGVEQLFGAKATDKEGTDKSSWAKQAGNLAGFILDFGILSKCTDGVMDPVLGNGARTVTGAGTKMFISGGIYGGIFTPSASTDHLLRDRLGSAAVDSTTFAVMGASNKYLEALPAFSSKTKSNFFAEQSLIKRVQTNAIAGALGGTANALVGAFVSEHRPASLAEVVSGAASYAAFGAGFGALGFGFDKSLDLASKKIPAVDDLRSKYYFATKDIHENIERRGYRILRQTGLDHPIRNLGDMIHRSKPISDRPHPPVTADNNPIPKFETALQTYLQRMTEEKERLDEIPGKDYKARQVVYDGQKQVSLDFAHSLIKIWNGSSEEPGLRYYTDAELATDGISPQRVAEIRQALTLTTRDGIMMTAFSKLAGIDISHDLTGTPPNARYRTYDLSSNEIIKAKEEYFDFDYWDVQKRLALKHPHHTVDREYATPHDWLAHQENEQLPGLFHGTGSQSFSDLFRERKLFSSKELRIRGIEQVSGESLNMDFPRRHVSLTRNYGVAWSYANISNDYVTGYPAMLGISGEAVSRIQPAGYLEPGEMLVDQLRLGDSIFGRKVRKEITHIHVPDSEVGEVKARLDADRIKGVKVFGFNQLKTPQWNELPSIFRQSPID